MTRLCLVALVLLAAAPRGASAYWNYRWTNVPGRNTVVLAAIQPDNHYYDGSIQDIIDFHVSVAKAVMGRDNVVIIGRGDALDLYARHLPDDILLESDIDDIWIRDFGPAVMHHQVLFKYRNQFNTVEDAKYIQGQLTRLLRRCGLSRYLERSNLHNDGGNVVDNGVDTAILSSRILDDNAHLSKQQVVAELKRVTALPNIHIIPAIAGDTTGHADGMVSFIDDYTLVVATVEGDPPPQYPINDARIKQIVAEQLLTDENWNNFTTACGWHVNLLATDNYLYIPTYGGDPKNVRWGHTKARDDRFISLVAQHTSKYIVRVPTPNGVCKTGGAVRCNTWQTAGALADRLIRKARRGYC